MTTWDIAPSGGDYTSCNAWAGNASTVASDIGEIQDDWTSTTDTVKTTLADNSLILRGKVGDQARNAGVDNGGTNHSLSTTADRSLEVNNTTCTVDGVIIEQTSTTSSNECIRVATTGLTFTLINSILRCTTDTSDQDCLYAGAIAVTMNGENNIYIGAGRAGCNAQQFSGANTQTWNQISPTIWDCGRNTGEIDGGGIASDTRNVSATNTINVFNGIAVSNTDGGSDDYSNVKTDPTIPAQAGTKTWGLDYCVSSGSEIGTRDSGAVSAVDSVTVVEGNPTSGQLGFRDITSAPFDLRLFDDSADNVAQDSHAVSTGAGLTFGDYAGSAVDIAGTSRPQDTNFDRGAFEVVVAGGGRIMSSLAGHGGLAGKGGIAGQGGGLAG